MKYSLTGLLAAALLLAACGGGDNPEEAQLTTLFAGEPETVLGLQNVASFASIEDEEAQSRALFGEMFKVIESPRCMNCHPRGDMPTQGDDMHPHSPPVTRGPGGMGVAGMECSTCHGDANMAFVGAEGSIPGDPVWHLAPLSMGWVGLSAAEICEQIKDTERNGGKSLEELHEHNAEDHLVGWGWHPGEGRTPAPGTQEVFGELTAAWIATGAHCPAGS